MSERDRIPAPSGLSKSASSSATRGNRVAFTKDVLDSIPRGRDMQNVFAMAPGVTQAVTDVGGSTMAQRQNLFSYGVLAQPKLQVEGMNVTMGADQNTAIYFNDSTLEAVQINTSGKEGCSDDELEVTDTVPQVQRAAV